MFYFPFNDRSIFTLISTIVLAIFSQYGFSSDKAVIKQKPEWVTDISVLKPTDYPKEQVQDGLYYLLVDTQVKVDKAKEPHYFSHNASYIVNQSGVEYASQINIDYSPEYQKLELHSLRVIRGDQVINKISSSRMKFIQREEELEELIYTGRETLNIIVSDVRVGDIIEYSFSKIGQNPVYKNIFSYRHSLSWSVPLDQLSLRVLWNKDSDLSYNIKNSDLNLSVNEYDSGIEYLLQSENVQPVLIEDDTPSWFSPWGQIDFSELQTWRSVAQWGKTLYEDVVVLDNDINSIVEEVKSKNSTKKDQISAALRFVQDEIRYLGIELGKNSHLPRLAPQTLMNRYGDCKDKTVLLLAILKGLDIQAYPALVNTAERLNETIPSINAFDHVITYLEFEGEVYWLDPTNNYQYGTLDTISQPNFGFALVLSDDTNNIISMELSQPRYGVTVTDTFFLSSSADVVFLTETKSFGGDAERQRKRWANSGEALIQKDYIEFYQGYYPGADITDTISVFDDNKNNAFTSKEKYLIKDFWIGNDKDKQFEASFYPNLISFYVREPDYNQRENPLKISHPEILTQIINIHFEESGWYFEDENFIEDNDFFVYKNIVHFDEKENTLKLTYSYQSKQAFVSPDDYSNYLKALARVDDYTSYGIFKEYDFDGTAWQNELELSSDDYAIIAIVVYFLLFFLVIFLRWLKNKNRFTPVDGFYFPISLPKLFAMWIFTFGLYGLYWFYKNFKYIKNQEKNSSMPLLRAFFCAFWYFPLWKKLRSDSEERFQQSHLPNMVMAIIMAIVFFVSMVVGGIDYLLLPSLIFSALMILPLANYILFVNGEDSEAVKVNSEWNFYHYLFVLLVFPLLLFTFSSGLGITPSDKVISGEDIHQYNLRKMHRNGVIEPSDDIKYFYSSAILFYLSDGNGFTEDYVFSYWKDDSGNFNLEKASYDEVKEIEVEWSDVFLDDTVITIYRKDGSDFVLYVSNTDGGDKIFYNKLKSFWKMI